MRSLAGSPSPGTARVRVSCRSQPVHASISARSAARAAMTSSVAGGTGGAGAGGATLGRSLAAEVRGGRMDGERRQQSADVAGVALGTLGLGAVADQLLERGSAGVAAEFVDRHGRSVPPARPAQAGSWAQVDNALRLTARARASTLLHAPLRARSRRRGHRLCTCLLYTSPSPRDRTRSR